MTPHVWKGAWSSSATKLEKSRVKLPSKRREQAAQLIAEDRYPDARLAERVGISPATLYKWKVDPAFAARVVEITAAYADRALKFGLARRERRLQVLSEQHERILRLIEARAVDPSVAGAAGGDTGLVVLQVKSVGTGPNAQMVHEYVADVALMRELRATEEQIARELGQWTEKRELTGKDGGPLEMVSVAASAREKLLGKLAGRARSDKEPEAVVM